MATILPCLELNLPALFADPEFMDYVNDPDNSVATWHLKGDPNPHEHSDVFVTYDGGEGSDSDMPGWDVVCAACEAAAVTCAVVRITNLVE